MYFLFPLATIYIRSYFNFNSINNRQNWFESLEYFSRTMRGALQSWRDEYYSYYARCITELKRWILFVLWEVHYRAEEMNIIRTMRGALQSWSDEYYSSYARCITELKRSILFVLCEVHYRAEEINILGKLNLSELLGSLNYLLLFFFLPMKIFKNSL